MSELFSFPKVTYVGDQSLTAGDGYPITITLMKLLPARR